MEKYASKQWRNWKGGLPLVADIKHEICKAYDVEAEDGVAYRGSFLIDHALQ